MSFVLKTVPLHKPKLMVNKGFYWYSPSKSAFFAVQKFPHFLCQSHSTGTSLFPLLTRIHQNNRRTLLHNRAGRGAGTAAAKTINPQNQAWHPQYPEYNYRIYTGGVPIN